MIEIELFYRTVESEIRRQHVKYLKRKKYVTEPDDEESSGFSEQKAEKPEDSDRSKAEKLFIDTPGKAKRFNKGVDMALKVLRKEYDKFSKRLKKQEKDGGEF